MNGVTLPIVYDAVSGCWMGTDETACAGEWGLCCNPEFCNWELMIPDLCVGGDPRMPTAECSPVFELIFTLLTITGCDNSSCDSTDGRITIVITE